MARSNGKAEKESTALDIEHELPAGAESTEEQKPQELSELDRVKAERDALLDRLARLQAEFDNYRKRSAREQQDFRDYALTEAIRSLLPIVDSFDRALAAPAASGNDFKAGIDLINRQFHDALSKLGVETVAAVGQTFDPTMHQAIQMVDTDEAEDNQVIDELQRGYKLKGRLLRPAMVRVARNSKKK